MTKTEVVAKGRTRKVADKTVPTTSAAEPSNAGSKLDRLADLLHLPDGATIADLTSATGWQQHSVRGALAGALKMRGLVISSTKVDGTRRYRATAQ